MELPAPLEALIDYRHPDALAVDSVMHSTRCYTLVVMDVDYRHYTWRANLSVDDRWSLAPVSVPVHDDQLDL